jgi:hypothetical protein
VKNHSVDSSSSYCTFELGLVKKYNTQVQFGTWGMDVGLPNYLKKQVCKISLLSIYFNHFNYIVGYYVYLK